MASTAEIINLDDVRAAIKAQQGKQLPFSWAGLGMPCDTRDMASRLIRHGLHPFVTWVVDEAGQCLCGNCEPDSNSRGKHPLHTNWQTAPLNPAALERDLARDWRMNLSLRMGEQPNGWRLITLDIDGDRSLLDPLEAKLGRLPPTLEARTGSGGLHLIYRLRDGAPMPPNSVKKLAPGVDIRSARGQIVCAPSRHYGGGRYTWTRCVEPAVLP
ncbi:MAG TPA: bifunctional DNA primase/polymerase [Polyangiaceae bacterium]|nr:bifunctional DNA primase/polymerase [Polyangiaceae bacterium]